MRRESRFAGRVESGRRSKTFLLIKFFRSMSRPLRPCCRNHEGPPRQSGLFTSVGDGLVSFLFGFPITAQSSPAQSGGAFERGLAEFRAGNYASAAALFADAETASPAQRMRFFTGQIRIVGGERRTEQELSWLG